MLKLFRKLLIVIIIAGFLGCLWYTYQVTAPVGVSDGKSLITFEISEGSSVNQVSKDLYDQGLIRSRFYFELYIWLNNWQAKLSRGSFVLSPSMNIKEITAILIDSANAEKKITIIEGKNLTEIAKYLAAEGLIDEAAFLEQAKIDNFPGYQFFQDAPEEVSLEGYLFPDTYRVFKNSSVKDIIYKFLDNFGKKFDEQLQQEVNRQQKTVYEVVTLASIVEKEVATTEAMGMVADIFLKRLKQGIALQSDATINFITGKGQVQPSIEDLQIDNLYNTYQNRGLPPGPIANPGLRAIKAVIYPTANPYYYFLTTTQGEVIFSKTYEEHLANKRQYLP